MTAIAHSRKTKVIALAVILTAILAPADAALVHQYELNGSFADAFGGPALIANGTAGPGTLTATGYNFLANQGLSLSNALPANDNYSILMDFSFTDVSSYRKILDFTDLGSDLGLYVLSENLIFYTGGDGIGEPFDANVPARVVLTRDGVTDVVAGYVNGVQMWTFTDTANDAVFGAANSVVRFFNDDAETGFGEASAGSVDRILVYDTPLSSSAVAALGGVPEPASVGLTLLGTACLLARRRRTT